MRYACIRRHEGVYAVALMCRVLKVSRAGYYAWGRRPASTRERADAELTTQIHAVHATSRRTYGAPRVHAELRAEGVRCGRKRVARLMREAGLRGKRRQRRRPTTTDSRHTQPVAPNVLDRQFSVAAVAGLDRVWAADLTYLPTREGWQYLAAVLDLGSRRVIGWSMRETLEREITLDALRMALDARHPAPGLLHHSDRGSQYASGDYQALLTPRATTRPSWPRTRWCRA